MKILTHAEQHYLSIENVADYLHMSDRTLKRQLAAEGTSFSNLVDEVRYRHATSPAFPYRLHARTNCR